MTCIVGLKTREGVWMGGDSAGVAGYDLTSRADSKVFLSGDFLFGFTSSFRMGDLLRYSFDPPKRGRVSVDRYMRTSFINGVREVLAAGGFRQKQHEVERGGTFLVGYAGRLFCIEGDFQVGESKDPFHAVGCGDQVALGAMHVLLKFNVNPGMQIRLALLAAERYSAGVRGPFKILNLPR